MEKLRVLVVGSGWGRNHALAYHAHPDVELLGICGRTENERSRALAHELQVPLYTGLDKTLDDLKPDVVSCATNEPEHEAVTVQALEAGAHIYCEKLLADTVNGAEKMVNSAEQTGRQLMVGYNYRFSPSAIRLNEIVNSGSLGDIAFASAMTFGYCLHHTLDLVCSLMGKVEEVYCILDADPPEPTAIRYERYENFIYSASRCRSITLKFAGGSVGTLISSDYMRFGHPGVRIDLVGSKARANMDDIVGKVTILGEDREGELWMPSLIRDRLDLGSTCQAAVCAFIDSIRDGKPVPVPGSDGLSRLRLEVALLRSSEENRPIRMEENRGGER